MNVFTTVPGPEDDFMLTRVLLRPDASVHIAIADGRSVYATPAGLSRLFSSPYYFLDSFALYDESSYDINPNEVSLSEITGLELACIWKDKRVQIDFPEIMQYVFRVRASSKEWTNRLNMSDLAGTLEFSDAKSYLLKLYLDFTNYARSIPTIHNDIRLDESEQMKIVRAIVKSLFEDTMPKSQTSLEISDCIKDAESIQGIQEEKVVSTGLGADYISLREYCQLHKISYIKAYHNKKRFSTLIQNDTRHWFIKKDDVPKGGLQYFRIPTQEPEEFQEEQKPVIEASYGSEADIKERIIRDKGYSPEMAGYIGSMAELEYYMTNGYKNVRIAGRLALVLDIKPDEFIKSKGKTNRQIIKAGGAPEVPSSADYPGEGVFVVHHVGQRKNSPFAIVPESIHGSELFSVFHQKAPDGKLHDKSFEMDKRNFWLGYLELYDSVGYDGFPSAK